MSASQGQQVYSHPRLRPFFKPVDRQTKVNSTFQVVLKHTKKDAPPPIRLPFFVQQALQYGHRFFLELSLCAPETAKGRSRTPSNFFLPQIVPLKHLN